MTTSVFLGRQPIFDRTRRTYAYELLYRNDNRNVAFFSDPDDATRRVLEVAMLEWGFDRVIGDRFGFINVEAGVLRSGLLALLPAERAVIELVETIEFDDAVFLYVPAARERCTRSLLDALPSLDAPGITRLAGLVDFVKIDLAMVPLDDLGALVDDVNGSSQRQLLAEKVEGGAVPARDRLGFDLFQGYFFAKPRCCSATSGRRTWPPRRSCSPRRTNPTSTSIASSSCRQRPDPGLRAVEGRNSSSYGLTVHVQSIRHAIVSWACRRAAAGHAADDGRGEDGISDELIVLAATRARRAAHLAGDDAELADGAFTAGLLR